MNVHNNARVVSLVNFLAATMIRKYPYACFEDVCQDLWIEILKVIEKGSYNQNRASIETFLFRHLQWRVQNWVRLAWVRHDLLKAYVRHNNDRTIAPVEVTEEDLCSQINGSLKPFEQKVFDQYVDPDPELLQIAKKDVDGRGTNDFNQTHLALYFGVSQMTISRAVKVIKKTTGDVLGRVDVGPQRRR